MSVYSNVLLAILPLFALILFGYIGKKTRLLHVTDAPVLNRFVLSVSLPAFILHALLSHHLNLSYIQLPFVFWSAEAIVLAFALVIARILRWNKAETGTLILLSVFGNTGYIGYPVTTALLPLLLPASVIIDQLGMSVPLYPGALALGGIFGKSAGDCSNSSLLRFFKSPIFIAMTVGILLQLIPSAWVPHSKLAIGAGQMIGQLLALLGGVTIPVVLIAVGLLLRPSALAKHGKKVCVVGVLKLIALPVFAYLVAHAIFHITGDLLTICVLQAAMPPSASATVFAGQYEMDGSLAVASFFALTVACAVTLPLMLSLLR